MAGSPRKRARKMGIPVPNAGSRPPKYPRARARALPLLVDEALTRLAKRTLQEVMEDWSMDPRDRVAASRVTLEALRKPGAAPVDDLDKMSAEELETLAAQAQAQLSGARQ